MKPLLFLLLLSACGDLAGPPEPKCVDDSKWLYTTDCRGCADSVYVEITICYERRTYFIP